jgi:hypothetical protein
MNIGVVLSTTIAGSGVVKMPEGRTWNDVESFYVKWGALYLTFKDGKYDEVSILHIDYDLDSIDHKYPANVTIHPTTEDGEMIDYNDELATS